MSTRPIVDDEVVVAVNALNASGGNKDRAAASIGLHPRTFRRRLEFAAVRGLLGTSPVLPGFEIKQTSETTGKNGELLRTSVTQARQSGELYEAREGYELKQRSTLSDAEGRIRLQWNIEKPGQLTIEETCERIKRAFQGYKPNTKRAPAPKHADKDLLAFIPCNDWHVNMLAWEGETGQNWDLKLAEQVIGKSIEDAIAGSPSACTAIVLGGGDLMHADNDRNRTEKSGNPLDADSRYQKGVEVAQRLKVRTIDAALKRHKHVIVRVLRGNHDEYSSVAIAYFLLAWYRNEPRVTVDVDASLFFWHRFGSVFLSATHGHTVKLKDMASIMAHRRAEDWGASKHRYAHGFHIHHHSKIATEGGGVIAESHQAPIPQDAWHYGAGFLSGRSVQTITYHREFGEIGRVRVAILDGLPRKVTRK